MTESSQLSLAPPLVEVRYFAAQRDDWELLLLRARQLGAATIMARVAWAWHAPTEGAFDFDGATDPQRDLVGFVRLCGQLGLRVLLYPGPLHGNLLGGGAPAWLLQHYPAACALDQDGAPWRDQGGLPRPSLSHPAVLAAARAWFGAFSAAMRQFHASDGPISALHIATTFALDWLRADGWSVALRHDEPVEHGGERDAEPGATVLLSLPGDQHALLVAELNPAGQLLRGDGTPCADFWQIKMRSLLLATAGSDSANASVPADLALVDTRDPGDAVAALAQRLRQASLAFDLIDLDSATPEDLARYALIVVPGALVTASHIQQRLAQCPNIALLGDQADAGVAVKGAGELAHSPQLPADISADQLAELIEQRGGIARYAWADGANIDLAVRYGANHTYLAIHNRRPAAYNGILAYRGRDGAVLHLHTGIGARCAGLVLLTDDEVQGAAINGDAAEGGWLARGLRSSAMFNIGAGALAHCGAGLLLAAPQSGRFQARRPEGWQGLRAYRLLLGGALLPAQAQIDAAHIVIAYVAEDAHGPTDMYLILPEGDPPPFARSYLATQLSARAAMLRRAALLAEATPEWPTPLDTTIAQASAPLAAAATQLEAITFATLDEYSAAWIAADELCRPALATLAQALTQARGALLSGQIDPVAHTVIERQFARIIKLTALGNC